MLAPWKKSYDQPKQHIKKQRHHFVNKSPYSQSYDFSSSRVWMWELAYRESWAPKIWCFWTVVLEKTLESPLDSTEIKPVYPEGNLSWIFRKDWCWSSNTLATWWEELTHLKRPWCWERLKIRREGDGRWDGWMASLTQWTWVWANSQILWRTGKPGMLQSMGSQRVRCNLATEQWTTMLIRKYLELNNLQDILGLVARQTQYHTMVNCYLTNV